MKKAILLISFILTTITYGQISVTKVPESELIGQIAPMGSLHIKIEKSGDTYTFYYSDIKFTAIDNFKSFSFRDIDNAFENLYTLIINGFEELPKEDIIIELPNDTIYLNYVKSMGVISVQIGHFVNKTSVVGKSVYLTKKKVQKLFGKAKKKRKDVKNEKN